jgi:transposase-like protein
LGYMFCGSCRGVSRVLSMGLEPISKSAVHYLARKVSSVKIAKEPRYRRCIAVDETKLSVKGVYVSMYMCGLPWTWIPGNCWPWRHHMAGAA